jgi:hypothetical protein
MGERMSESAPRKFLASTISDERYMVSILLFRVCGCTGASAGVELHLGNEEEFMNEPEPSPSISRAIRAEN